MSSTRSQSGLPRTTAFESGTTSHRPFLARSKRISGIALVALASLAATAALSAQTYFPLSTGNYSENFADIANTTIWPTTLGTNSWSGNAVNATGTIPDGVRLSTATTSFVATGSSGGVQRGTANIQLLSTGATDNTSSAAIDLNLNFSGRQNGLLSFNAATVNNSTGNRSSSLRVYYSTNGTSWTELTGSGLPFTATNNVVGSAAVSLSLPAAVNNAPTVKLRFYYHNGSGGNTGSRPRISIDDVTVTSESDGADTTPPTVAASNPFSPADGATNVSRTPTLSVSFSEAIAAGTGNITLKKANGDTVQDFAVGTSAVTISGVTASFTPTNPLDYGADYYVVIPSGAIIDTATSPNAFAGISDPTTWNFTTLPPDTTPPAIVSVTPANAATPEIAPPTTLTITFNEKVQLPLFDLGPHIRVKKLSDDSTVADIDPSAFGGNASLPTDTVVSINVPGLTYGVQYYVEIDAGAILDDSGNEFAGLAKYSNAPTNTILSWTFTTLQVPDINTLAPYTQTFSTYTSASTLPLGWSLEGITTTYLGNWGAGNSAGALGNANVFGYQHTGSTGTVVQKLVLRNNSGAPITDLVISYDGRVARATETRIPIYSVALNGTAINSLAYSTADGDNVSRVASVSGLNVANGATFTLTWTSDRGQSAGSSRQIGISNVSVSIGVQQFAPTVTGSFSLPALTFNSAEFNGNVTSDGNASITARGFVYAETATNATPTLGGTGVTTLTDGAPGTGIYSSPVTGLSQTTSYTFRAYATNSVGTSYSSPVSFTTLTAPPTLVSSYSQAFDAFNGTLPAGWTSVSSGGIQTYVGAWGNGSGSAGFTGGVSSPGVLGYQHTGGTGTLTTTLTLINGTGATLNQLYIGYLGRTSRTDQPRAPGFVVSVNGSPVTALAYSSASGTDASVSTTLTGLGIADGATFTVSWVSDRGTGSGASRQIGLSNVYVGLNSPTLTYDQWKATNANGDAADVDSDGDGIDNGAEFFMGTSGVAFNPAPTIGAGNTITWPRASDRTVTSFKVEVSTDLSTWESASLNYPSNLTIAADHVSFTLPAPTGKFFVRLSVTP